MKDINPDYAIAKFAEDARPQGAKTYFQYFERLTTQQIRQNRQSRRVTNFE